MYIFQSEYSYCDYMCKNFKNKNDVILINPNKFSISKILQYLSSIEKKIFKIDIISKIWYKSLIKLRDNNSYKKFCFFDSCFLINNQNFLKWLRDNYKNCIIVLIIVNHIGNNYKLLNYYKNTCDYIFSFDIYDCESHGFIYFDNVAPKFDSNSFKHLKINKYDIGFIGRDKGRYDELKKLYIKLKGQGKSCYFYIYSDIIPKDSIDKEILHNKYLSFKKVINLEYQCKCLLDYNYVEYGEQGYSLRILDALNMGKYIITNNSFIKEFKGYNEKYIKIICNLNDISLDFIGNDQIKYDFLNLFSGEELIKKIDKL